MLTPVLLLTALAASSTAIKVPRGVSTERAKLYINKGNFNCLTAPKVTIPASKINDNYCDCPDGSDEPGTSACSLLSQSALAIPGFYCENKGYRAHYIPLNRVDDGICDCCDGSDEPKGVCKDTCKSVGKEWKKERETWSQEVRLGVKEREKLEEKAQEKIRSLNFEKAKLAAEVEAAKAKVKEAEEKVKQVEEEDKLRTVKQGGLSVPLGLIKDRLEAVREALSKVILERDDLQRRLDRLEDMMKLLHKDYNPNFNDEAVKAAVRGWEEYQAGVAAETVEKAGDDVRNLVLGDEEEQKLFDEINTQSPEIEDLYTLWGLTTYLPPSAQTTISALLSNARTFLVENGLLAKRTSDSGSTGESAALTAARGALSTAQSTVSSLEKKIRNIQKDLDADHGPNKIFLALKDECVSKDVAGYTYTVCFGGRATQKSLRDGAEVTLGNFESIAVLDAASLEDERKKNLGVYGGMLEDRRVDGSGEVKLKYGNGQACWNGPRRSVEVELVCAKNNELREVREAQKCVYEATVGSPAVCRIEGAEGAPVQGKVKDEL